MWKEGKHTLQKRRAISLLVLIITIVVTLIIAGATIITVMKQNSLSNAKLATLKTDLKAMVDSFEIKYDKAVYKYRGDVSQIVKEDLDGIIPEKYQDEFRVSVEGVEYTGDDSQIKTVGKELGILIPSNEIVFAIQNLNISTTTNSLSVIVNLKSEIEDPLTYQIFYRNTKVANAAWIEASTGSPNNCVITNLPENNTFEIKAKVTNDVTHESVESVPYKAVTKEFVVGDIILHAGSQSGSIYTPDTWINQSIYIQVKKSENASVTYSITNGGRTVIANATDDMLYELEGDSELTVKTSDGTTEKEKTYRLKIDKKAPEGTLKIAEVTSNSITAKIENINEEHSGVREYAFYLDGILKVIKSEPEYTFTKLTQSTTYKVEVKIRDNAINEKILKNDAVTIDTVAPGEANIAFTLHPANWTNQKVTVTVVYAQSGQKGLVPQFSEDGQNFVDVTSPYETEYPTNRKVYARYRDSEGQYGVRKEIHIWNIDKLDPLFQSLIPSTTAWTNQDVIVTATAQDQAETKEYGCSGIQYYQLSTNAGLNLSSPGWQTIPANTGRVTQTAAAAQNGTYYFYFKDQAGNVNKKNITISNIDKIKPTITIHPNTGTYAKNRQITITAADAGGSGLKGNNEYQFYLSSSNTELKDGAWTTYTSGSAVTIGTGITGTRYVWVKRVGDNAGNWSSDTAYHVSGAYVFDNTGPTVTINPTTATVCKNKAVTVTVADVGAAGLSSSNSYQYYLSNSNNGLAGGAWTSYTSGNAFTIGNGLTGTYYLYVKQVSDNLGNVSAANKVVSNVSCYMVGPYVFDNSGPIVTITPNGNSTYTKNTNVTITIKDEGTAGLNSGNSYQYYLSTSATTPTGGTWTNYTNGSTFNIGAGITGSRYLFIKPVSDTLGNASGTNVAGYIRSNIFNFDNTPPDIEVTVYKRDADDGSNGEKRGDYKNENILFGAYRNYGHNFVVTGKDAHSGYAKTNWRWNKSGIYEADSSERYIYGANSTTSDNPRTVGLSADGLRYGQIDIVDKAGNVRTITVNAWIDKKAPSAGGMSKTDPNTNGKVTITGKSTDTGSGIDTYKFSTSSAIPTSGWEKISPATRSQVTKKDTVDENDVYYFFTKDQAENVRRQRISISSIEEPDPCPPHEFGTYHGSDKGKYTNYVDGVPYANVYPPGKQFPFPWTCTVGHTHTMRGEYPSSQRRCINCGKTANEVGDTGGRFWCPDDAGFYGQ